MDTSLETTLSVVSNESARKWACSSLNTWKGMALLSAGNSSDENSGTETSDSGAASDPYEFQEHAEYLLTPHIAFGPISAGVIVSRHWKLQFSDKTPAPAAPDGGYAEFRVGRYLRDELLGNLLAVETQSGVGGGRNEMSASDIHTRFGFYLGCEGLTARRERLYFTLDNADFMQWRFPDCVLWAAASSEQRNCVVCGSSPNSFCGCPFPQFRPKHVTDYTLGARAMALQMGSFVGQTRVMQDKAAQIVSEPLVTSELINGFTPMVPQLKTAHNMLDGLLKTFAVQMCIGAESPVCSFLGSFSNDSVGDRGNGNNASGGGMLVSGSSGRGGRQSPRSQGFASGGSAVFPGGAVPWSGGGGHAYSGGAAVVRRPRSPLSSRDGSAIYSIDSVPENLQQEQGGSIPRGGALPVEQPLFQNVIEPNLVADFSHGVDDDSDDEHVDGNILQEGRRMQQSQFSLAASAEVPSSGSRMPHQRLDLAASAALDSVVSGEVRHHQGLMQSEAKQMAALAKMQKTISARHGGVQDDGRDGIAPTSLQQPLQSGAVAYGGMARSSGMAGSSRGPAAQNVQGLGESLNPWLGDSVEGSAARQDFTPLVGTVQGAAITYATALDSARLDIGVNEGAATMMALGSTVPPGPGAAGHSDGASGSQVRVGGSRSIPVGPGLLLPGSNAEMVGAAAMASSGNIATRANPPVIANLVEEKSLPVRRSRARVWTKEEQEQRELKRMIKNRVRASLQALDCVWLQSILNFPCC